MISADNLQSNYIYSFSKALDAKYFLSEEQKKQVMLFCYFHNNDFPIGMHSHEFYEINIITEGTGEHYIENNSFHINSGDFFIIPPNIKHGYAEQSNLDIFHIILSDKFFSAYGNELRAIHGYSLLFNIEPRLRAKSNLKIFPSIAAGEFIFFRSEIDKLYRLSQSADVFHETEKCIKTMNLICNFADIVTSAQSNAVPRSFIDIPQITTVLSYIDKNYSSRINLKDLCRISNMSRSTLLHQFHAMCNCSPTEYLLSVRIDNARKLLADSRLSIATIAQDCGFYDSAHFTKTFFQQTNMLPKDYRNSLKKISET